MIDVAVIGAGISGLSAAYYFQRAGLRVHVFEAEEVGGAIQTLRVGPYLLERGPNSLRDDNPAIQHLLQALNLERKVITAAPAAKKRFILQGSELVAIPSHPLEALTSSLLPFPDKLKIIREPFVAKGLEEDESIREFVARRMTPWIADNLVDPLITGVYAGDTRQLSMRSSFPKLWEFEQRHGSILKGALASRKHRSRQPRQSRKIFSFSDGLGTLTGKLRDELNKAIQHSRILRIEPISQGYRLYGATHTDARRVILATPAYAAADLLQPLNIGIAEALRSIEYPHVAVASFAFKLDVVRKPVDGFGFLVSSTERRDILGCIFTSSLWNGRAPEDEVLLTVMLGGARRSDMRHWTDAQLTNAALRELTSILEIRGDPAFTHLSRWPRAIPQYHVGHHKILSQMEQFEREFPGLHLLSNYRGGISVGACIGNAHSLATTLTEHG